jgi:Rha family phage regulatory protein
MSDSPKHPASNRVPAVFGEGGEIFADSRDVAKFFEKRHDHVLRDIDNLIRKDPDLQGNEFTPSNYGELNFGDCNINGLAPFEGYRCFHLTRDGFTLLAMGFTGPKALTFKIKYIEAFNAMEAELLRRRSTTLEIDIRDPAQFAAVKAQLDALVQDNTRPAAPHSEASSQTCLE